MNKGNVRVSVVVETLACVLLSAESAFASVWYDGANGTRFWDDAPNWHDFAPRSDTFVELNNAWLTVANPLCVTNGVTAVAGIVQLGSLLPAAADGRVIGLKLQGGTLSFGADTWKPKYDYSLYVGFCSGSKAVLMLESGMVLCNGFGLNVGYSGFGVVTNVGCQVGSGAQPIALTLGDRKDGVGRWVQNGGESFGDLIVGNFGSGMMTLNGGVHHVQAWDTYVGKETGSIGALELCGGEIDFPSDSTLFVGYGGIGRLEVFPGRDAEFGYLKIGGARTATASSVVLHAGTTTTVMRAVNVGGYVQSGDLAGSGLMVLSNATLRLTWGNGKKGLYVGRVSGSVGELRGNGYVYGSQVNDNIAYMALGNGRIVADGFGENRTLDFREVVSVTNLFPNAYDGTNGWYAVNGGRVIFPRTWSNAGSMTGYAGTLNGADGNPDLVGSIRFSITGMTAVDNHVRGAVCAADRTDLNLNELPPHAGLVNVWQVGLFNHRVNDTTAPFKTASLTFRYDHVAAASQTLSLWRHESGGWRRVARVEAGAVRPLVSVDSLASVEEAWNVGTFALTKDKRGVMVIIR